MVDWNAVSSIATATALLVSSAVFGVQLIDRRRLRADQARAQAEQVAGWLTLDREEESWTAHVRNGSTQPVYDVLYVVRDANEEDTDAARPEIIPVIPPETTWSWPPQFYDAESLGKTEEEMKLYPLAGIVYELKGEDDVSLYVGSIRPYARVLNRINARAYMTFRDGRGLSWQRDSHGRIRQTRRPVDWAPRAARATGRITWWA